MITNPYIIRIVVSSMFFMAGLCFSSWASRIATIQQTLSLTDAALGGVLFSLPVGLLVSLPLSGWAVAKAGSRKVLTFGLLLYGVMLIMLGLAENVWALIFCLILFGMAGNAVNIAVNTQAVATELLYSKPIMASFHGVWSLAGFFGAGFGTFMIGKDVNPAVHFLIIAMITGVAVLFCWKYLHDDEKPIAAGPAFVRPDKSLVTLGIIAFCSMIVEGAMFDWSVIYFKKVVMAEKGWIGAGYTAGMCTMALGRFVADWFSSRFGRRTTLQVSGLLSTTGLLIAILFPSLPTAIIGFMFVGAGISAVVPLVYSAAGKSTTMLPGPAIAAVSTISFIGFLIGPPVIGLLAGAFSLKVSFIFLAVMAFLVVIFSSKAKL